MEWKLRRSLQAMLMVVNVVIGMTGIASILYSIYIVRVLKGHTFDDITVVTPWFIYIFLSLGVLMCILKCNGQIAAETANGYYLSRYIMLVLLLLAVEAAAAADASLNKNWERDFPLDPTGRFDALKDFIRTNITICKWMGSLFTGIQVFAVLIAVVLRALGPDYESNYDSDEDYTPPPRLPLLRNEFQKPQYAANDLEMLLKDNSWILNVNDKVRFRNF